MISEPAPFYNTKYRKTVHSLERYRHDDQSRHEEYQLQPLLRVRSLKAIDHRALSAPSSPVLQPRYRSYERSNIQYTKQSNNQQGHQDNYQSSISKSASMPNGGFPVQTTLHPPPPPQFYPVPPPPPQGMRYRERVIDKHVAERSTSRGESHSQQQQQHARSASASGHQNQHSHLSIPVRYEESNNRMATGGSGSGASGGTTAFRSAYGQTQEFHPIHEQHHSVGSTTNGSYRQQGFDQQMYTGQPVGRHPTRIVN